MSWNPLLLECMTTNDKCYEIVMFLKNIMKVVTNGVDIIVDNEKYFITMITMP
jgi:hypothetical protein